MSMYKSNAGQFFNRPVEDYLEGRSWAISLDDATVRDVVERFSRGQEAVIVVDDQRHVVGIITPSDFDRVKEAFDRDPNTSPAEVMTQHPDVAYAGEPLSDVLAMINRRGLRTGIPVVDRESNEYAGFLSRAAVGDRVEIAQKRFTSWS